MARSKSTETIILDEPDVYMHADLQRKLIKLMLDRHEQVIVATHSVEMMSEVDEKAILIVDRKSNRSAFADSIPAVQGVINSVGAVHNLQLARLWNSRKCLSVEGDDISYLKPIHSLLFPQSQDSLDSIPNIKLGGWSGWSYAIGSRMLLKNALGDDIMLYCILDSDYHTQDEIDERRKQAMERGVQLHIWRKKEIENYLIIPQVIHRIIAQESAISISEVSVSHIEEAIDALAERQRETVFDAIANESFTRNRAGGLTEANKLARLRVDEAWESRESRLAVVSGKTLISMLSRWSQEHFKVQLSAMRIVRELARSEIDFEIRRVITAIEKGLPFQSNNR